MRKNIIKIITCVMMSSLLTSCESDFFSEENIDAETGEISISFNGQWANPNGPKTCEAGSDGIGFISSIEISTSSVKYSEEKWDIDDDANCASDGDTTITVITYDATYTDNTTQSESFCSDIQNMNLSPKTHVTTNSETNESIELSPIDISLRVSNETLGGIDLYSVACMNSAENRLYLGVNSGNTIYTESNRVTTLDSTSYLLRQ